MLARKVRPAFRRYLNDVAEGGETLFPLGYSDEPGIPEADSSSHLVHFDTALQNSLPAKRLSASTPS